MTAPAPSVRIGGYSLEVTAYGSSFAQFEPEHETDNAQTLTAALAEADDAVQAAATGVEDFQESATAVTDRIDQADKLYREIADGRLLELGNVSGEIDALLGLLGRLDKQGRFEDELRLMRSLNRLLVLGLRWYDLVRSLRRLLHSAEAAGHRAAQNSSISPAGARLVTTSTVRAATAPSVAVESDRIRGRESCASSASQLPPPSSPREREPALL